MENQENNMDTDLSGLVKELDSIYAMAYNMYSPMVEDICEEVASKQEVERLLERLLDFCGNAEFVELFRAVCRRYYRLYPELVAEYIMLYHSLYTEDDADKDDTIQEE